MERVAKHAGDLARIELAVVAAPAKPAPAKAVPSAPAKRHGHGAAEPVSVRTLAVVFAVSLSHAPAHAQFGAPPADQPDMAVDAATARAVVESILKKHGA